VAKIWSSFEDVDRAVETICGFMQTHHGLPETLRVAYRDTLAVASRGQVQRFWETLHATCPEAVTLFMDVKPLDPKSGS
jgi:hypothetical protein